MTSPLRISAPPSLPPLPDNARWEAVLARDARFDDRFYYSVRTTGIYCRPSCPARRPSRAHVLFHDTAAEAEAAGFRACKRCKPDQSSLSAQHAAKLAQACQMIEAAESPPTLATLANAVGLSPYHFHRRFKAALGVTPKAYAAASRNKRMRTGLRTSATVTEALYDAGFNSNSRFYAAAPEVLGMGIKSFRAGAPNEELRCAVVPCALGQVLVAASDTGVCAILLGDGSETLLAELRAQFPGARLIDGDAAFAQLTARVVALVDAPGTEANLPLDVRGTAFQHRVWEALCRIPAGATATYADIAALIGAPSAARAVAGACAANRLAVAIPCHRVVRGDGSLSGYRWGVARKRLLLAKESE